MNVYPTPASVESTSIEFIRKASLHYLSNGFTYAGLEVLFSGLTMHSDAESEATLCNDIARCYVSIGLTQQAFNWFSRALEHEARLSILFASRIRCNLAMTYDLLNQHDMAIKEVEKVLKVWRELPEELNAAVLTNVSTILYRNDLNLPAVQYTEQALETYGSISDHQHHLILYHNLGCYHMELGSFDKAEWYLLKSHELSPGDIFETIAELSRLYMRKGDIEKSLEYGSRAVNIVWATTINYEKQELARLCQLLAHLTFHINEASLAYRLIEKAQLFYGQIGSWRDWELIDEQVRQWEHSPKTETRIDFNIPPSDIRRFLSLLDVVHAQELLGPDYSVLFDVRTRHALALAERLQFSEADMHALAHACRFADFGLTAMELDVIKEPERSPYAWTQYQQHPQLSVDMLAWIELPKSVTTAILQHHERCDGQGYPHGLTDGLITPLASVLAIADAYAHGVVLEQRKHSSVVTDMLAERGTHFNSEFLDEFVRLFEIPDSETE